MMNFNNTFQLSIYLASLLSFLLTFLGCFIIIRTNNKFEYQNSNQKRLSNLNIVPLGGIAMASSFFISVRFLGEADSNIQYIALFALGVSALGIIDDFKNLNWKLKIVFQFLLVLIPISQLNLLINIENLIGRFFGKLGPGIFNAGILRAANITIEPKNGSLFFASRTSFGNFKKLCEHRWLKSA